MIRKDQLPNIWGDDWKVEKAEIREENIPAGASVKIVITDNPWMVGLNVPTIVVTGPTSFARRTFIPSVARPPATAAASASQSATLPMTNTAGSKLMSPLALHPANSLTGRTERAM